MILKTKNLVNNISMSDRLPHDPARWGPPAWDFLYCVAFSYPYKPNSEQKKHMYKFLKSLAYTLPCETCRENYKERFKRISTEKNLRSKRSLVKWIMKLKNEIASQHNGKLDTYAELCIKYQLNKIEY